MKTKRPIDAAWVLARVRECEAAIRSGRRWFDCPPPFRMVAVTMRDFTDPLPVATMPERIVAEYRTMGYRVPGGQPIYVDCYAFLDTYFTGHVAQLPGVVVMAVQDCKDPCLGLTLSGGQVALFLPVEIEVEEHDERRERREPVPPPVLVTDPESARP